MNDAIAMTDDQLKDDVDRVKKAMKQLQDWIVTFDVKFTGEMKIGSFTIVVDQNYTEPKDASNVKIKAYRTENILLEG